MKRLIGAAMVAMAGGTLGGAAEFQAETIDAGIAIGYGLEVADVDGDGLKDVVLADQRQFVWYQNPTWRKHVITEALTEKDHVCLAARDIDGDGRCEIAVGAEWNPGDTEGSGAVFYLVPGEDRTQLWRPVQLPHEPTTHRMRWLRRMDGRYDLVVLPLHGRGNVQGEGVGVRMLAYRRPEDPRQEWTTEVITEAMHATHNFEVIPAMGEEAEDVLLAGREGVVRLSDSEKGWRTQWISDHRGESGLLGAGEVRYGAFANGRPFVATVEPMHGNELVVYTPPAVGPKDGVWQRRVLTDQLVDGHALMCRDVLGLGNRQIVVGWRSMRQIGKRVGIQLWSTTKEDGGGWRVQTVDDDTMACEDLTVADLDGDGDKDVVACGRRTRNVVVYWQK